MEMLPCSGLHYVGQSDCPEHGSESAYKYDEKSDFFQDAEQVGKADVKLDEFMVNGGEPLELRDSGGQFILERFPATEGCSAEDTYYEFDNDGQNLSCDSHDSGDEHLDQRDDSTGPGIALEDSQIILDAVETELPDCKSQASSYSEIKALEADEAQAVWVKWRGKWQAGIRCARADWPLLTVKAKPTHGRKQYLVIFFPRTRNYSWADVLLVRPINEFPEPIAYKTHKIGLTMVKDLTLSRRFIMQKLAVSMLNILDQLPREALVETARKVLVLKEFAMEASRCKDYSDLGRMLMKLQNMILECSLTSLWLQHSLQAWKQQCQVADSAESVELLKEELNDSILWNEVSSLTSVELESDWKSWKHEVMKWFSFSHPISSSVGSNEPINAHEISGIEISRKRPKLEVRRADAQTSGSHQSVLVETDSSFFNGYGAANGAMTESETPNKECSIVDAPAGYCSSVTNKWDDIVVEAGNMALIQAKNVEANPVSTVTQKVVELDQNRQCIAFIEAKGRRCVRYANEGDVYCCVHLASRFVGSSAKTGATPPADSRMCEGTTVLGTKCKHRALIGTSFCKKHRPHDGKKIISPVTNSKRKNEEALVHPESKSSTKFVIGEEAESSVQFDPLFGMAKGFVATSGMSEVPEAQVLSNDETGECIGSWPQSDSHPCLEIPKRHSLYCEKHIPSWLKRARNGKTRIVSKEVFTDLLKDCHSREQKLQLHQACELFYRLLKSILSLRNPVPKEVQFQWAISEASRDLRVGEYLMKLVLNEKVRLKKLWGFGDGEKAQPSSMMEELVSIQMLTSNGSNLKENGLKCKICSEKFLDDQMLGEHWMDSHKKEAQWLFRGYVCAFCLDSFTNKKVLETHVQERHRVEFVEQCMLLQCISCSSHFGNSDQLWSHVLSNHPCDLRLPNASPQHEGSLQKIEPKKSSPLKHTNVDDPSCTRRFICRFCGLKFDLLPDLGRHHQAVHMSQNSTGPRLTKKGIQFYAHKLKSGRLSRPRFQKGLNSASYKIRNRIQNLKKSIPPSNSVNSGGIFVQSTIPESSTLGRLADSQCSAVAKLLFSEIKKTKLQPSISEILSMARSSCCKINLAESLECKYGTLPERMYLKAAKLCSEHDIVVEWHQEGYICPKGCTPNVKLPPLPPLIAPSNYNSKGTYSIKSHLMTSEWTTDECHCVIDSRHFSLDEKNIILCDDISFGQESVPIACVVDENLLNSEGPDGQISEYCFPWESFTYVTKPLLDQSLIVEAESSQLGCACAHSTCFSAACDHVYLFDNDYEDAKDIYGKPMNGRFPYDERGRIILEEGYLVYECNERCRCSKACQNRVLQNGVQLKLEIFKTEKKGWAVRTREAVLRGTFVCEYIGEFIDEQEANERRNRYDKEESCSYLYEIDAHINDMSRLIEGQAPFVIDATNYGNVSRYINHSCSPNLVNHQVLVNSMDCQRAHIGFYAKRDISSGEELTYDFRYKLVPGDGCPCLCGSSNCRGRLY